MLRAVARRARLPAASLALGGATLAAYTHGSDEEYRRISEETLPLKCERPDTQAVDPHAASPRATLLTRVCRLGRYDPVAIEQIWSQHRTCVGARVAQGSSHALPFAARLTSDVVGDAIGGRLRRAQHAAGPPADPACAQQAREQARTPGSERCSSRGSWGPL